MILTEQLHQISPLQQIRVSEWHRVPAGLSEQGLLGIVEEQHLQNYLLWHEEDTARDPDASDAVIAGVKRRIDLLNQKRNDLIERLDEAILENLLADGIGMNPNSPLNSETPGSMIDRCSIMALKIYHMEEQVCRTDVDPEHLQRSRDKVRVLSTQRQDLFHCLFQLIDDVRAGFRQFKLYRQFKMYNDPTLNPQIYKTRS